ncbi:ER membrane protein complex subunit 8 [Branchiostoma belcheri]|nr:ER membrane protein complex subunit 8 [Branchiostoma belcheri]
MAEIEISVRSYVKLVLHAAKYPHCAVNGVLLADRKRYKDDKIVCVVECVPLFHLALGLAPMLEVALSQIDAYCEQNKLIIAGYYHANEHVKDSSPNAITHKVMERICDNFNDASLYMVDNTKMTPDMEDAVFRVYALQEGKFKERNPDSITLDEQCLSAASGLLNQKVFRNLVDFDNHLDDITQDWLNNHLNEVIEIHSW